ncbi:hypothetical protein glysoja_049824, partial [Glycine soja]
RPKLVAGSAEGYSEHVEGRLREARMNHPKGITVDNRGNIYVADIMKMTIRKFRGTKPSGRSNYTLMIVLINAKMDLHLELQCLLGLPSLAICLHYYNVDSVQL